jgi:LuxR family transcriptional regulator, maltose regulon positive regulatory protein
VVAGRPAVPPAKNTLPRRTPNFVHRPRLTAALDAADPAGVVLVSAPAGYGKTLLLGDWAAHRAGRTGWLTLDGGDNVDRRFWAGVLTALADGRADALSTLPLPAVPSRAPPFLAAVTATVAAGPPVTLVLDDLHVLTAPDPLHGLAALVRDRPRGLQLVLATRSDPPLRLERLRLSGRLTEIRARALAFSPDEAAALLLAERVALRPDQFENLLAQTEGWTAGLRLAALSLARSPDPDAVLRDLVGNGPALTDYLVAEVLSRLPAHVVDVLAAVSVCDRVSAPLAAVLTGRADAGDVLADLERTTSLVVGEGRGRQRFRVHPLLRAQLSADLQRRRPDRLALLHSRAARHRSASGHVVAALRHAGLAGDAPLVAALLQAEGPALAVSGHHAAVLAALDALPPLERSGDVRLMLVAALAHLEVGHRTAATRLLEQAEAAWPDGAAPDLEAMRTTVRVRLAPAGAGGWVGEAAVDGGCAEPIVRTTAVELLQAADDAAAAGLLRRAQALARAAATAAVAAGERYLEARATAMLAALVARTGDVRGAAVLARRATAVAPAPEWHGTVGDVAVRMVQAYWALLQARPDECLRWASGVAVGSMSGSEGAAPALSSLRAAAMFDLGEHRTALEAMTRVRLGLDDLPSADRPSTTAVAALEHDAAAALGLRGHARAVAEWAADQLGPSGDVLVMQVWGPVTIGRVEAARERLRRVLDGSVPCVLPWMLIQAHLLDARLELDAGRAVQARRAMERAVALAGETGAIRPLVTGPANVGLLLTRGLGRFGAGNDLVREILAQRAARLHVPLSNPLTERERDVLELLPTLLSLDEIAGALAISINTVRSHVRSLHGKLGVASRADAVVAARRDGLIPTGAR